MSWPKIPISSISTDSNKEWWQLQPKIRNRCASWVASVHGMGLPSCFSFKTAKHLRQIMVTTTDICESLQMTGSDKIVCNTFSQVAAFLLKILPLHLLMPKRQCHKKNFEHVAFQNMYDTCLVMLSSLASFIFKVEARSIYQIVYILLSASSVSALQDVGLLKATIRLCGRA